MSESLRAVASRRSDHHAAKRHWSRKLLAHPERGAPRHHKTRFSPGWNVVGVGIGEKFANGNSTGLPAIKFLVRKKVPKRKVGKIDVLPSKWNGLLTDVEEVGEVRFLSNDSGADPRQTCDPIQPGCSIGYNNAGGLQNAGTLSALVEDPSGKRFFLSSFHVLADLAAPDTSFDITQPGTLDDPDARVVGRMFRGVAPSANDTNRIDAALADVGPNVNTSAEILGIGAITGVKTAAPEMTVEKFGRNTGYRAGYVFNIFFDISVPMPSGEARFIDQIAILGLNGPFAGDGDSGSLVLERESNRAVGLLFVQAGTYSLANHISTVLSGLGVVLVA
jgi:hypothetical protein